jgi:hypothetical protein
VPAYLQNEHLLHELELSRQQGKPTPDLSRAFILLVNRLGTSPCFRGYSYLDEMKGQALLNLSKVWARYDTSRGTPFSFFTAVASREFLGVIKSEKKQTRVKDALQTCYGCETHDETA